MINQEEIDTQIFKKIFFQTFVVYGIMKAGKRNLWSMLDFLNISYQLFYFNSTLISSDHLSYFPS